MAFRLYDYNNEGYITYSKVKEITEKTRNHLTKGYKFNFDCELMKNHFGKDFKNKMSYHEFTVFLNKFNYELAKQQFFNLADKESGTITAHQFKKLMSEIRPHRLSPFVSENLIEFAFLDGVPRITYSVFASVNNLLDNIELVKKVFDRMSGFQTNVDSNYAVSEAQFLQEALRTSPLTPLEVKVLFKFVRLRTGL